GNLRELQSALKHAVVEATGPVLLPEFLPESLRAPAAGQGRSPLGAEEALVDLIRRRIAGGTQNLYDEIIQGVERTLLGEIVHHVDGNIRRAAAILGISRSTLRI